MEAYRGTEPSGLDFALGRYGAFLLDKGRLDEAATVLEEAIRLGTDIPAIWNDYLEILTRRRDLAGLFAAVDSMVASVRFPVDKTDTVLRYAKQAERSDDPSFAESVARRALEEATARGDEAGRWPTAGVLGQILDRADRVQEAVVLWAEAFEEGSNDPITASRLSMHLERSKDYKAAARIIRVALGRGLPANVEEQLRKRLARCEVKVTPGHKRADVPAFSVRHGEGVFELVFQVRLKPPVTDLEIVGATARCFGVSKGVGSLIDVDLGTGAEIRRVDGLPELGDTQFSSSGWGIGIKRTAKVGAGPTELWFLDPTGAVVSRAAVPDASSQIALGPDLWYVGCRDGRLYVFDSQGRKSWEWETPGARGYSGDPYFRPCPYYVASGGLFAAVASMGTIYAVSPAGATLWHAELPDEQRTTYTFSVPISASSIGATPYRALGLSAGASLEEVKRAYRRLALATHPDRNPEGPEASAKFREVQGAYEAIVAAAAGSRPTLEFAIHISGPGPTVTFLAATGHGVVAGSSQGRLYRLDQRGKLQEARILGDGPVRATLRLDGSLAAAWCDGAVFFFRGHEVVNAAGVANYPMGLDVLEDDVLLWRANRIDVMDRMGRLVWAAEFSKRLSKVAAHSEKLVCAAGVLTALRRTR
jgi:tetratricopeptide (TPR) repeat protein